MNERSLTRPPRRGWSGWRGNLALLIALVLLLAACGGATGGSTASDGVARVGDGPGSSASASPSASKDPEEAMLAFAKCMRAQGIDMPDPGSGQNGGFVFRVGGSDEDGGDGPAFGSEEFQKAEDECREHLEGAGLEPGGAGELSEEAEEAMLAFAKCMREQGIDMPDPGAGGFVEARPDDPVDPFSEEFQKAQEACREHLQALPTPQDASGGQP